MMQYKFLLICLMSIFLFDCSNKKIVKNKVYKPKHLSINIHQNFEDWFLSRSVENCMMFSYPISSSGNYLNRDYHYMVINYNTAKNTKEIYIVGGYLYQKDSFVKIYVNKKDFYLQPIDNQAWVLDDDKLLKNILFTKEDFLVFSKFSNGTTAIDKYSVSGFKDALIAMNNLCPLVDST